MEEITSAANPLVKLVRSLAIRKHRIDTGLFAVEGLEYASKAQAKGFAPHLLLIDRDHRSNSGLSGIVAWAAQEGARAAALPSPLLARVSRLNNPQVLVLVLKQKWHAPRPPAGDALVLALDSIRDPGNLGTIIRTLEAAACSTLYLIGESCDPFSPEAVRASAGSIFSIEISALTRREFLKIAASWRGDIIGTRADAAEGFRGSYRRPILLLMGSESRGLAPDVTAACTRLVRIPMAPGVESLNVATAAALMLYELQLPILPMNGAAAKKA